MKRTLDVISDFEQLRGALVGKTIQGAEIVQEDIRTDFLVLTMDDDSSVRIDAALLFSVEIHEGCRPQ